MMYAGYALQMLGTLFCGVALGGHIARHGGPPHALAVVVVTLVGLGLLGVGVVYALDIP